MHTAEPQSVVPCRVRKTSDQPPRSTMDGYSEMNSMLPSWPGTSSQDMSVPA